MPTTSHSALGQIRQKMAQLLRIAPESRELVAEVFELLETVEGEIRGLKSAGAAKRATRPTRRGEAVENYTVQSTPQGEMLVEHRRGSSQPFRCPRRVYDATTVVVAKAVEGLHFEEIWDQVASRLKERPADYLVRICLRFWMAPDHAIVSRSRSRYHPTSATRFVPEAERAWRKTVTKTKQGS